MTERKAYPQWYNMAPEPAYNLTKWRDMAHKIQIAARQYDEYSNRDLVQFFTDDWDYQEREHFRRWLKYNEQEQPYQHKRGQSMATSKVAYDFQATQKEEQLSQLKKKLRGRINSAEKLLNKMLDEGLLAGTEEKAIYIGRILQKLKEEIGLLRRPELMQARSERAMRLIRKAGLDEVAYQLTADITPDKLIKVAEDDLSSVLSNIKVEIDAFNYGVHLNRLMEIKAQLEKMGRHSEAGDILDIIKKDLNDIDGIHKSLVEVYTSLGQIPRQEQRREERPPMSAPAPQAPSAKDFERQLARDLKQPLGKPEMTPRL